VVYNLCQKWVCSWWYAFQTSQDDIIWVKIRNSKLSLENDFYIALFYVIPDDSSRQSMSENNVFDRLLDCWK
jgi:hypothetical protein